MYPETRGRSIVFTHFYVPRLLTGPEAGGYSFEIRRSFPSAADDGAGKMNEIPPYNLSPTLRIRFEVTRFGICRWRSGGSRTKVDCVSGALGGVYFAAMSAVLSQTVPPRLAPVRQARQALGCILAPLGGYSSTRAAKGLRSAGFTKVGTFFSIAFRRKRA